MKEALRFLPCSFIFTWCLLLAILLTKWSALRTSILFINIDFWVQNEIVSLFPVHYLKFCFTLCSQKYDHLPCKTKDYTSVKEVQMKWDVWNSCFQSSWFGVFCPPPEKLKHCFVPAARSNTLLTCTTTDGVPLVSTGIYKNLLFAFCLGHFWCIEYLLEYIHKPL